MPFLFYYLQFDIEGLLPLPNSLAIPNNPPFMIDTDSMAFLICRLICRLIACFFCMNGKQQYCPERMRGVCKRRLKIPDMFVIKFLFSG